MIVRKWIEFPGQEVDIEISGEEAVLAITDNPKEKSEGTHLHDVVNNLAWFLNKLPDTVIGDLTPKVRNIVADFFEKQAQRFRVVA